MAWEKRYKTVDGLEMESRKCTHKGKAMEDVWIPKCPNNSLADVAEAVEANYCTEIQAVARTKQGWAIEEQHKSKAGLGGKLTQTISDAIEDKLTNEEIKTCFESDSPSKARKALILSIHQQNISEMLQTADDLADEQATMPDEPEEAKEDA